MPANRNVLITDATIYALILKREGRKTTTATNDIEQDAYKELIRFIRSIERQEILLRRATIPNQRNSVAYELKNELDALAGRPIQPYAPVLDYYRLVPAFAEWLAKPHGRADIAVEAAADLVTFLDIQSERRKLEAIAWAHVPDDPVYRSSNRARIVAVRALGRMGCWSSLSVLESLHAHNDAFVRHAVAEALLSAPPAAAIPILKEMTADTRPAAWTLIRLGEEAESTIIEILREPTFRSSAPDYVIREYYEHWKDLPAPPSAAIVAAIYDRVQAEAGRSGPDQYGLDVLKLAGKPFVVRNVWQDLEAALTLVATKGQEARKDLMLDMRLHRSERAPAAFMKAAEAGNLEIRRIVADRTSALAHVADWRGQGNYVLWLNRVGVVWSIWVVWDVPADKVQDRVNNFLKDHAQAKEAKPDDSMPETGR
jgi:HEAT repeat protein